MFLMMSLFMTSCLDLGLSDERPQESIELKEIPEGTRVEVSAEPRPGFNFSHWAIGNEIASYDLTYVFNMPPRDISLTAHFIRRN
jgi:hypothetical protein